MASLILSVKDTTASQKMIIELDAARFEKLAADFGFFNPEFIKSLERAEADERAGRVRTITSLKQLRRAP